MFYKKAILKNLAILIRKHWCWNLFLINFQAYKPATLLQRDSNTGENRDVSRDDNWRRIQSPVKYLR